MKKILIIIIAIILLGAIGFVAWLYIGEKPPEDKIELIKSFFPFGGDVDTENGDTNGNGTPNGNGPINGNGGIFIEKRLNQLTEKSVTGAAFYENSEPRVRYIEKSTGHIYEIDPKTKKEVRISNITFLKTFESAWSYNGEKVIIRYIEDNDTAQTARNYSIALDNSTSSVEGVFLTQSIRSLAPSLSEDKIFYLEDFGENTIGKVSNFEGEKQNQIFSLSFGEFNINWPNKDIIHLLTKPSVNVAGYLYSLNPKTESFKKVLGWINGLTALSSPSGKKILYSESHKNFFSTSIYDTESKTSSFFELTTLPEKCVWSKKSPDIIYCAIPGNIPRADYPDEWYQGFVSFSDTVWKIYVENGSTEEIYKTNLDVTSPFLSTEEDYLFFISKIDNTLWSLKLIE